MMVEFEDSPAVSKAKIGQGACCFPLLPFLQRRGHCAVGGFRGAHVQKAQGVKGMAGVLPG